MESREDAGFVSGADETTSDDHMVFPVEARSTEIVVDRMDFESFQRIEMIFRPFPSVAGRIVMTRMGRRIIIDAVLAPVR